MSNGGTAGLAMRMVGVPRHCPCPRQRGRVRPPGEPMLPVRNGTEKAVKVAWRQARLDHGGGVTLGFVRPGLQSAVPYRPS